MGGKRVGGNRCSVYLSGACVDSKCVGGIDDAVDVEGIRVVNLVMA